MVAMQADEELIQDIVGKEYKGAATCVLTDYGGRILKSTRKLQRGEAVGKADIQLEIQRVLETEEQKALWNNIVEIFGNPEDWDRARPRFLPDQEQVVPSKEEANYELDVVWSALGSLVEADVPASGFLLPTISEDLQRRICLHHVPDDTKASDKMIKLHEVTKLRCSALKLERMVQLWSCNCLDQNERKHTQVLSLGFALMNHCCQPNITWEFEGNEVVLRANKDIEPDVELSVSYIEDQEMHKPAARRQQHILDTGKGFTCGCWRCAGVERCRYVCCPALGCNGLVLLTPKFKDVDPSAICGVCARSLTAEEIEERVLCERELEKILGDFEASKDSDSDSDSDSSDSDEDDLEPGPNYGVDKITAEQVARIQEIATSGNLLAPTGHWLSFEALGLLKDVAWKQKAGPVAILACLDGRASFVRQAYPTEAPNQPPLPDLGWELCEAAELLLKGDGWPSTWSNEDRCKAAYQRLTEGIEVLTPMKPNDTCVVKAHEYIAALLAERIPVSRTPKQGKKRLQDFDEGERAFNGIQSLSQKLRREKCN